MIQIAAALPTISAGPARPVLLAAQSGASNFALALSSLLVPGAPKALPGEVPIALPGEASVAGLPVTGRQAVAEPGKELPEIALDLSGDEEAPEQNCEAEDDAPAGEDLPFAWFALPSAPALDAAPVVPPAIAPKAVLVGKQVEIALPEAAMPGAPAPAQPKPGAAAQPVVERDTAPISASNAPATAPLPQRLGERPVALTPRTASPSDTADTPVAATTAAVAPAVAPATTRVISAPARGATAPAAAQPPAPDGAAIMSAPLSVAPALAAVQPPRPAAASIVSAPALVAVAPASFQPSAPAAAAPVVPAPAPVAGVPDVVAAPLAPAATQPAARIESPMFDPVREPAPAAVEAPAPRVAASPGAQAARQPVKEAAQPPLTVASLIAQASLQTAAQPIAFAPLRRSFGEFDQPVVTSLAAPSATTLQQVAAAPHAQQGALDMRRHEWMGKMVETIEAMREAAPIRETRISLIPDALGKVDISVRQDGDRVHVHFAAETQAARQILTDAQPRLTELAEARGIRLGQTSVDSQGTGAQSGQRQNDAQRPQNPSAPASARAAKDQFTQTDDERVA